MIKLLKKLKRNKEVKDWKARGKTPPTPQLIKQKAVRKYANLYNIDTLIETGTYMGDMIEAVKDTFKDIYSIELSEVLYAKCKKRFNIIDIDEEKNRLSNQFKMDINDIKVTSSEMRIFKGGEAYIFLSCGDSAKELPKILANLQAQCPSGNCEKIGIQAGQTSTSKKVLANAMHAKLRVLFWLDAHYSGGDTAHAKDCETPIKEELKTILNDNPKHIILIDDARLFVGENDYPKLLTIEGFVKGFGKKMEVKDDIIRIT